MPRGAALISAAAAALLLLVYAVSVDGRLWVHFAVSQACHGTSGGKIGYLLVFVMVGGVRVACAGGVSGRRSTGGRWLAAFAAATGIGLAATALAFCAYVREFGIPLDRASFHWSGGVNSVNSLTHMHTGKAGLALLIEALGWDSLHSRFDTGVVFLGAVPRWLAGVILVSFVGSVIAGLGALPGLVRDARAGRFLVAVLCMAWLSKCVLDGGPLAYDAVAGGIGLGVLAAGGAARRSVVVRVVLVLGVWQIVVQWLDPGAANGQLWRALSKLGLLAAVGGLDAVSWRGRAVPAVGAAVFAVSVGLEAQRVLAPLGGAAPGAFVVSGPAHRELAHPGETRLAVYRRFGDNPLRVRRVSLGARTGGPTGLMAELIVVRAGADRVRFGPTHEARLVRIEPVEGARHARMRIEVAFDAALGPVMYDGTPGEDDQIDANERFLAYAATDRMLRASGVEAYILIPYVQYADPP